MKARVFIALAGIVVVVAGAGAQTFPASGPAGAEYYVAPDGKTEAIGTKAEPWDIYSVLAGEQKKVQPGDTIWIGGGVYAPQPDAAGRRRQFEIKLAGAEAKPVLIRQAKGERAILDGGVVVSAPADFIQLWDLEIAPSPGSKPVYETTQRGSWPANLSPAGGGLTINAGKGCKYVNLYIHDNPGGGVGFWVGAVDSEFYGCVIVNNGWKGPDRYHGHSIYAQNNEGVKRITNCVMSTRNGEGQYTIHVYTERGFIKNFQIEDNIVYAPGTFLVGGGQTAEHISVRKNYLYRMPMRIRTGTDCVVQDNVLFRSPLVVRRYKEAVIRDNLLVDSSRRIEQVEKLEGTNKTETPTAPLAVLLPNRYDSGRANLAIFNFTGADSVDVEVEGFLKPGEAYRLMDPEDLFGKPVHAGTCKGDAIAVPMKDEFAALVVFKGAAPATRPK